MRPKTAAEDKIVLSMKFRLYVTNMIARIRRSILRSIRLARALVYGLSSPSSACSSMVEVEVSGAMASSLECSES